MNGEITAPASLRAFKASGVLPVAHDVARVLPCLPRVQRVRALEPQAGAPRSSDPGLHPTSLENEPRGAFRLDPPPLLGLLLH